MMTDDEKLKLLLGELGCETKDDLIYKCFRVMWSQVDDDEIDRVHAKVFIAPHHGEDGESERALVRVAIIIAAFARVQNVPFARLWAGQWEELGFLREFFGASLANDRTREYWASFEPRLITAMEEELANGQHK
jgi:hypothetical protein